MNITVGSRIELDRSFLEKYVDRVQFRMPSGLQEIGAIGTIEMGNARLIRYHFIDHEGFFEVEFRFNVLSACRLFVKDMEEFPVDEQHWQRWREKGVGRLGAPTILHGDYEYKRMWNGSSNWVRPVLMVERMIAGDSADPRLIEKLGMMYYRVDTPPLGSDAREFREMLIILMDNSVVETYVGIDYDVARIR